jgi:hypothetical protein
MTLINKSLSIAQAFVLVGGVVIISVHQYLDQVVNILLAKSNENAVVDINGPRRLRRKDNRVAVIFRARVKFESGHVLEISDDFLIEPSGDRWTRSFSYFLGMPHDEEMDRIFLFDTHGLYGEAAHLDLGNDERLSTGDPRLNGFEPDNIDVTDICRFIDLYLDGQPFPWVAQ